MERLNLHRYSANGSENWALEEAALRIVICCDMKMVIAVSSDWQMAEIPEAFDEFEISD